MRRPRCSRRHRRAFTLIEVLIATAITLLMMISLVQVFKIIGDSMKQGRASLQMNNTLRAVTFRLRHDLGNLTVRVDPPSDASSGGGYFEYFEGAMNDSTAGLFASAMANRFGDADDIAMFTARAGDSWFTGRVPERILTTSGSTSMTPVTITSQLAEIAVFCRPLSNGTGPTATYDADGDGFPDGYQLHYRVLLIRPDLNIAGSLTTLPNLSVGPADTPTTMATWFQSCDLSMRRVYDGDASTADFVAANSLEDLANPAHRFAHFQFAATGTNGSCTMPLMVMEPISNSVFSVFTKGLYPEPDPAGLPAALNHAQGNFIDPAYVLGGTRYGEDILATNVVGFDIKGYDPGAPVICAPGPDGVFGVGGSGIAGQDGSDDVVLTPNDPGYAAAYAATPLPSLVSYGEYVDLLWGRKVLNSLSGYSMDYTNVSGNGLNVVSALSGLQGTLSNVAAPPLTYSDGLLRSGKALAHTSGPSYVILQPTFDTWTTTFESNGTQQTFLPNFFGILDINAFARLKDNSAGSDAGSVAGWRLNVIDAGTDGIDNNGAGGVDDAAEMETLPPFPIKLRGVKMSVRIEDKSTRQIKQMSVAHEFVTQ